ncbi:hypothetical protein A3860_15575 [Niastella vici]|uniref:Uncharacterized protein n=1 Tax=Niastella vici TaxID=1703345 RepID=A0A1V9G6A7_9BACT|nr:hypothetical protein [Niastella vici]OQP66006.1 hypothetical protein A3860_15575 [Niastella vici]
MTKQITSYKELLQEKARLKTLMAEQELQIKEDWRSLKEELKPAAVVAGTIRNLFTRKHGIGIAQIGVNLLADGLIKKVLLANTGWLTKWLIPFFIKNYASHLSDEPKSLLNKIKAFFKKNGKMHHDTPETQPDQETGMDAV